MGIEEALSFRRSSRFDLYVPARVSIARAHAPIVKLSAQTGSRTDKIVADLVDYSTGGLGLVTGVFIPRRTLLAVELLERGAEPGEAEAFAQVTVRVQRVIMTDRRPAYLLGTEFVTSSAAEATAMYALLDMLETTLQEEPGGQTGGSNG